MSESDHDHGPWGLTTSRDVVRIAGPDAERFLQGQISQDLDALAVHTSTWTFVLAPTGKVDAWARLTKTEADAFILDVDGGAGSAVETRLRRFLLRTKAEIDLLDWAAVAVRGADAPRGAVPDGVLRLPLAGLGTEGYDLIGPGAALPDDVRVATADELVADRIVHGVPAMGAELDGATIPAEVGPWIIEASVSFTKGCFVGQELTARIDSRGGNVPRRLRGLVSDQPLPVGAAIEMPGPPSTVTSSATSPSTGPVALAFCGRAVDPGTTVTVGGISAVVAELPLA